MVLMVFLSRYVRDTLYNYIEVNDSGCEKDLREAFEDPNYHRRTGLRELLKQQLADLVVKHIVSMQDFEFLTRYYFKTEQEYYDYLKNEFWPDIFPGENPEDFCSK